MARQPGHASCRSQGRLHTTFCATGALRQRCICRKCLQRKASPGIQQPRRQQAAALTYWARLHAEHLRRPTATAPQPLQVGVRLAVFSCM